MFAEKRTSTEPISLMSIYQPLSGLLLLLLFPYCVPWPLLESDTGLYLLHSLYTPVCEEAAAAWASASTITPSSNTPIIRSATDVVILLKDLNNLFTS